jgi:hypothetical protein
LQVPLVSGMGLGGPPAEEREGQQQQQQQVPAVAVSVGCNPTPQGLTCAGRTRLFWLHRLSRLTIPWRPRHTITPSHLPRCGQRLVAVRTAASTSDSYRLYAAPGEVARVGSCQLGLGSFRSDVLGHLVGCLALFWQVGEKAVGLAGGESESDSGVGEEEAAEAEGEGEAGETGEELEPEWPPDVLCPISWLPMDDAVIAADGHSYQRAAIEEWIARKQAGEEGGNPGCSLGSWSCITIMCGHHHHHHLECSSDRWRCPLFSPADQSVSLASAFRLTSRAWCARGHSRGGAAVSQDQPAPPLHDSGAQHPASWGGGVVPRD